MNINRFSFKFQYDNTLSSLLIVLISKLSKFKFQYDNTLRLNGGLEIPQSKLFKFQYDNTLSKIFNCFYSISFSYLNSNMIIL